MSLYFANVSSTRVPASGQYAARELDYVSAALGSLHIRGTRSFRQMAYDGYKSNIAIFLSATANEKTLLVTVDGAKATRKEDSVVTTQGFYNLQQAFDLVIRTMIVVLVVRLAPAVVCFVFQSTL